MDSKKAYEQIKTILEHGMMAEVLFRRTRTPALAFMIVGERILVNNIDKNLGLLEYNGVYSIGRLSLTEENEVIVITPVPRKFKKYEVGQKVRVMENAGEIGNFKDWDEDKKNMVGKICEIERCDDCGFGLCYFLKEGTYCHFPHYCLAPVFEDEDETIEINGIKYNKSEVEERLRELKPIK